MSSGALVHSLLEVSSSDPCEFDGCCEIEGFNTPLFETKSEPSSLQGMVDVTLVSVLLAPEFCNLLMSTEEHSTWRVTKKFNPKATVHQTQV